MNYAVGFGASGVAGPGSIRSARRVPQIPKPGCWVSALRVTIPRARITNSSPGAAGPASRLRRRYADHSAKRHKYYASACGRRDRSKRRSHWCWLSSSLRPQNLSISTPVGSLANCAAVRVIERKKWVFGCINRPTCSTKSRTHWRSATPVRSAITRIAPETQPVTLRSFTTMPVAIGGIPELAPAAIAPCSQAKSTSFPIGSSGEVFGGLNSVSLDSNLRRYSLNCWASDRTDASALQNCFGRSVR